MNYPAAKRLDPILERVLPSIRRIERFLGPDDDWVADDRRILSQAAQQLFGHLHEFVTEKYADEYVMTVSATVDEFENALLNDVYQRNILANKKYRTHHDGGRQWAEGSYVHDPADKRWQHHVYVFPTNDGRVDVYAHTETSVREGYEHLTEPQHDGTTHKLYKICDTNTIAYGTRKF